MKRNNSNFHVLDALLDAEVEKGLDPDKARKCKAAWRRGEGTAAQILRAAGLTRILQHLLPRGRHKPDK